MRTVRPRPRHAKHAGPFAVPRETNCLNSVRPRCSSRPCRCPRRTPARTRAQETQPGRRAHRGGVHRPPCFARSLPNHCGQRHRLHCLPSCEDVLETLWGLHGGTPVGGGNRRASPGEPEGVVTFYGYCIRTGIVKEKGDSRTKLFPPSFVPDHTCSSIPPRCGGRMSRFVSFDACGALSHADAAPPQAVALAARTRPHGGGREPRRRSASASRRPRRANVPVGLLRGSSSMVRARRAPSAFGINGDQAVTIGRATRQRARAAGSVTVPGVAIARRVASARYAAGSTPASFADSRSV